MSLYTPRRLDHVPGSVRVIVGWDAPLATFYAQVWQVPRRDGALIRDLVTAGIHPYEIDDPASVVDLVRPYAHIPEGLHERLTADRLTEADPTGGRLRDALIQMRAAAVR
ncbi:hypothetical protein [Streptomyces rubradiris]|uniref:Uncharacterized protein n=1 Tax=Streptomyces rubradiris TaxID=285531 RepID=A0ABQ3RAE6_STRRR|nr:hypothetical protein [Streptomyces rubradiris]GHH31548.1 hypothetical protein GCM10018792_79360 [Streptomyces rubradiris]GHI52828.1 hypothetical protein Srubr_26740 [Streptomyces rubradiris]